MIHLFVFGFGIRPPAVFRRQYNCQEPTIKKQESSPLQSKKVAGLIIVIGRNNKGVEFVGICINSTKSSLPKRLNGGGRKGLIDIHLIYHAILRFLRGLLGRLFCRFILKQWCFPERRIYYIVMPTKF
jgi:hypothetical protein